MEIKNGVTVHRVWGQLEDAELLAVFQYQNDAQDFCEKCISRQPVETSLVWINHYDGKMHIVRHAKPAEVSSVGSDRHLAPRVPVEA